MPFRFLERTFGHAVAFAERTRKFGWIDALILVGLAGLFCPKRGNRFEFSDLRIGLFESGCALQYTLTGATAPNGRQLLADASKLWLLCSILLVAILGCVSATVVGVTVGVLRLSSNWLISRLMTVYVEVFRNIPLLLWILVILAIFTEVLPPPNAYRGENPAASMILFDTIAPTNRYTAIPSLAMTNPPGVIPLGREGVSWAVVAFALAIAAALIGRHFLNARAQRIQDATGQRPTTWWINLAMLVAPVLALIWYYGLHLVRPELKGFNFVGGLTLDNAFVVLWLALTLYTGAFIAEIVRGGILAVSKGQSEAAFALGLRPRRTMSLVILPQALRVIVPPLISQYLNLTKNSSLAIAVGYMDLRGTLGGTTLNQTGREMECMVLMMGIYLLLSLIISGGMNVFNSSVKLKER